MTRRCLTILILAAIALQGAFGGGLDSVAICLGGGHSHAPHETVSECHGHAHHHCEHDAGFPMPAPSDNDDSGCGCTDIELALIDLLTTPRGADDGVVAFPAPAVDVLVSLTEDDRMTRRGIHVRRADDPGGRMRCARLRTTRILI